MTATSRVIRPETKSLSRPRLRVDVARNAGEVLQAQRLRYEVFAEEQGARLKTPIPGIDCDRFDPACEHLIVINEQNDSVVATTRLLAEEQLKHTGDFYSASEFDLSPIKALHGRKLEVGRTCVAADYRNGATIALLWSGIARYIIENRYDYLLGCGSIPLSQDPSRNQSIIQHLMRKHGLPENQQVQPLKPVPANLLTDISSDEAGQEAIPPLIKAYTRLGAHVGGAPCWDPDFDCMDFLVLLSLEALENRYAKHFLREKQSAA